VPLPPEHSEVAELRSLLEDMRRDMESRELAHQKRVEELVSEIHQLRAEVADLRSERDTERLRIFARFAHVVARAASVAESVGTGRPWRQVLGETTLLRESIASVCDDVQAAVDREDRARHALGVPAEVERDS